MSPRKISDLAIFVDVERKAAVDAAKGIAAVAHDAGVRLHIGEGQAPLLGLNGAKISDAFPRAADLLVSLGGDGTLLQAAHLAAPYGIPIVGVDFGRVGFLTQLSRSDHRAVLSQILHGGFETEKRIALEATTAGASERYFALNDIHIDRTRRGGTVNFGITISGEHVADIPADGIVVSSPTGSTAYFLSAGGPILAPRLEAFGIAPICPHTLFSRPLVVGAGETIGIAVPPDCEGAVLYADGRPAANLAAGSAVTIARAERPVEFVRFDNRHFFEVLERKLHWGTSIKGPTKM